MASTGRARVKRMAMLAVVFAFMSLTQAGIHALDIHEAGRGTSEALGQILDNAVADGSITIDHDGLNTHLAAMDPALRFAPADDPGAWLQEHWIGPRVGFLGVANTFLSICLSLAFLVLACWIWPSKGIGDVQQEGTIR